MGRITSLQVQQKNKARVNVEIDGQYAFSLDAELVVLQRLKKGMEIDEVEMKNILLEDEKKKAFGACLHYLSYASRTEQELIKYLEKKEYNDKAIEDALEKLKHYGYINDGIIAKNIVKTKANELKSKTFILQKLKQKGIEPPTSKEAIEKNYTEELEQRNVEILAEKYLKKYMTKYKGQELKAKTAQGIISKGYGWDLIQQAVEKVMEGYEEELREQSSILEEKKLNELDSLIEKYQKKYSKLQGREAKQKISQALLQKGYTWSVIREALEARNKE